MNLSLFDCTLSLHLAISLLHFLWQGLVLAIVVAVGNATIGRNNANIRYGLSFSALVLMLVCLLVTFGSVATNTPGNLIASAPAPDAAVANTSFSQSKSEVLSQPANDLGDVSVADPAAPAAQAETAQVANAETAFFESWTWLAPYVAIVYLIGFTLMTVRFAVAFYGGDRLRRGATVVTDPQWVNRLNNCIGQIKCAVRPTLMTCDRIATPLIVGVLKPVILLPTSLLTELSPSQVENILLHELAHLRRYDNLANLFQRVVETLLFFHPAVWYVSSRVSDERENCCDDLVISIGAEPSGYAETLLRVVELGQHRARLAAGASLAVDGNRKTQLRTRVSRVMGVEDRAPFRSSRFAAVAVLAFLGLLSVSLWNQLQASPTIQESEGTLTVSLVDSEGVAVVGAQIEIKDWSDGWKDTDYKGTSDKNGEVAFENFKPGYYPAALVKHQDFAPVLRNFSFEKGTASRVTCKLLKPESGSLRVLSPEGKPIAGAVITRLDVSSTESSNKMVLLHDHFEMLTGRPSADFVSDQNGLISLPPLPAGSLVRVKVLHPHWKSARTEEADIGSLKSKAVVLARGTIVTAKLVGDASVLKELEGENIEVVAFTNSLMTSAEKYGIKHSFSVKDGAIEFCLADGQYDGFYLNVDGFSITPRFASTLIKLEFTNIPDAQTVQKKFVVRKRHLAKGRLVTEQGEPVAKAGINVLSQNLFVDEEQKLSPVDDSEFDYHCATTDAEGYYEIEIPEGPTRLTADSSGDSPDEYLKANFQKGKPLPDLVSKSLPVITGKILSPDGRPVSGAFARVITLYGESKYVRADKDGNFELKIKSFEYDIETEKRRDIIKLLAFDPHGPLAGIVDVDVSDKSKYSDINIELAEHKPDWIEQEVHKIIEPQNDKMLAKMGFDKEELEKNYAAEKGMDLEQLKAKDQNKEYEMAPEFDGGTWFNSDSDSLEDFRGQYVLLDFWFIGCGPCERGIPSLKLVHELFRDRGFTVISVHIAGQPPESVKQFCDARGMNFPLVVDGADEKILKAYKPHGVEGFPTYLLINPKGEVVPANLHQQKIETIRKYMLLKDTKAP